MTSHARQHIKSASAFAWLLVVSVLFTALLPMHYHLHHDNAVAGDDHDAGHHIVDLHPVVALADVDHHKDVHTIEAVSDATIKASSPFVSLVALFLSLVLLLPAPARMACLCFACIHVRFPRLYWHNSPPLRAPPSA